MLQPVVREPDDSIQEGGVTLLFFRCRTRVLVGLGFCFCFGKTYLSFQSLHTGHLFD